MAATLDDLVQRRGLMPAARVSILETAAPASDGGAIAILTSDERRDRIAGAPAQADTA
jgi:hypothetical protein